MKLSIIEARVRRNNLKECAGSHYRDNCTEIVINLNKQNKNAYLGIQNDDGLYTIIAEDFVCAMTNTGKKIDIPHNEILEILQNNGMENGKDGNFEFVPLNENGSVWFKDGPTMSSLWNTILLFDTR